MKKGKIGKSIRIEVKDLSSLKKYGFKREIFTHCDGSESCYYHLYSGKTDRRGEPHYCISVNEKTKKITISSSGGFALKTLCEMYKNGDIEFIDVKTNEERIKKKLKRIAELKKEIEELENEDRTE